MLSLEGHLLLQMGSSHCRAAALMYFFSSISVGRITCSFPLKKDSLAEALDPSVLKHIHVECSHQIVCSVSESEVGKIVLVAEFEESFASQSAAIKTCRFFYFQGRGLSDRSR